MYDFCFWHIDCKFKICYNNHTRTADQYAGYKWLGCKFAPLIAEGLFRSMGINKDKGADSIKQSVFLMPK
jgi:hypothetical protein